MNVVERSIAAEAVTFVLIQK